MSRLRLPKKIRRIIMALLFIVLLAGGAAFFLLNAKEVSAAWYNGGWSYRKRLTIDRSKMSGQTGQTLTSFPVLVNLTDNDVKNNAQSDGDDILFTNSDGTTKLTHELESYTSASGKVVAWVQIPTLNTANDYEIYMYYGNPGSASQATANSTWDSNYKGVYHLSEGSGTTAADKTSLANDFTLSASSWNTSAQIGTGWNGDGAKWLSRADDSDFDFVAADNFTVSMWVKSDSATNPGSGSGPKEWLYNKYGTAGYALYFKSSGFVCFGVDDDNSFGPDDEACNSTDVYDTSWHYVTAVKTGTTSITIYVDGASAGSDTSIAATGTLANAASSIVGDQTGADNGDEFNGDIDEFRISNTNRSADWILTDYNTQNSSTTFFSNIGNQEGLQTILNWKFDEGTSTTANDAASKANLSGTLQNTPTWAATDQCVFDKCIRFDGSNDNVTRAYSSSTDTGLLPSTATFAVSAWFRHVTSISGTDMILDRYASAGYKLYMNSSGFICFGIDDDSSWANNSSGSPDDSACTTTSYADSKWHFVKAVKVGTTSLDLYLDGVLAKQTTSLTGTATLDGSSAPLYVGIDADGSSNPWDGWIDDVKFYKQTGTAAEQKVDKNSKNAVEGAAVSIGATDGYASLYNGLVGYWKLDESSGNATDSSGNATTLTNTNSTPYVAAKFTYGGDFESGSSQYEFAADNATLSLTGEISISAWIKPESNTAATLYDIAGKWDGANESYLLAQYGDEIRLYIDSASTYIETSSANLSTGTWYNIVGVYTPQNTLAKIFVNGIEQATTTTGTIPSSIGDDAGRFQIGAEDSSTAAANFYDGIIDDVRLYNRPLQDSEIRKLLDWGPPPAGWWALDENTGSTTSDKSANGNTSSSFTNNTAWTPGKYNSALIFDGTDDATRIVEATAIDFGATTDSNTVEAWIKNTTNYSANATIVAKDDGSGAYPFSLYLNSSEQPCFQISDGTNSPSTCSSTAYTDGLWHHIVGKRDIDADTIYIIADGLQRNSTTDTTTATTANNDDISIGNSGTSYTANDFNGSIDEVRIYRYPLSIKQITVDMNNGHPPTGGSNGGPAGWWKFDDNSGTTINNSGNCGSTCAGTATNMANPPTTTSSWTASGKLNSALLFDGTDDYVTAGNQTQLSPTTSVTVSAWIKPNGTTKTVAAKFDTGTNNRSYQLLVNSSSQIQFTVSSNGTATTSATGNTTMTTDGTVWYHVAGVYDGMTLRVYVNGKLDATPTAYSSGIFAGNAAITIGTTLNSGAVSSPFTGTIDEPKIYTYALNDDEMRVDYAQGGAAVLGSRSTASDGTTADNSLDRAYCLPGDTATCRAPLVEYLFEDKPTTTAIDTSGHNNNGTLSGTAAYTLIRNNYPYGNALSYSTGATTYIDIPNQSTFSFTTGGFTIAYWFNISSFQRNGEWDINKGTSSGYGLQRHNAASTMDFVTNGLTNTSLTTSSSPADGNWHYLVLMWDTANKYIYIDNKLDTSAAATGTITTNTNTIHLGVDSPGGGGTSTGKIDSFRIYDYARTRAQLSYDYNKGQPTGWWKFDECSGSSAGDASGNSFTGTLNIGATGAQTSTGTCSTNISTDAWSNGASGKLNASLKFDGTDDYVSVSDTAALRFDNTVDDFSIMAWVKRTTTGTEYIVSKEDADNDGWRMLFSTNTVVCSEDATDVSSSSTITDTSWHLIGCTIDRDGNGQVYIDGVANGSTQAMGTDAMATTTAIRIGTRSYTSTSYLNGQIDDLRVYNYVLTANQIKQIYFNGPTYMGPTSGFPSQ